MITVIAQEHNWVENLNPVSHKPALAAFLSIVVFCSTPTPPF